MGSPLVDLPKSDTDFAIKVPVHQAFDDCAIPARPGNVQTPGDVSLAQVVMAGGCGCLRVTRRRRGGRRMKGGRYALDVQSSVGGDGPNVGASVVAVPCDARAGIHQGGAAPGSSMPVYENSVAGFTFRPSNAAGATLPDGVTAYMEVVPQPGRVGGSRRRRSTRRARKTRRSRRNH